MFGCVVCTTALEGTVELLLLLLILSQWSLPSCLMESGAILHLLVCLHWWDAGAG